MESRSSIIERFANSVFMQKLDEYSKKLSGSPAFSSISEGMMGSMGITLVGAVFQIITSLGSILFGWTPEDTIYQILYLPYDMSMGLIALFMAFSIAYNYANRLKISGVQAGFTALISFFIVSAPVQELFSADGIAINAMDVSGLGATGIFVAIIIAIGSVRITKLAIDKDWIIKMPDSVPPGILNSFNSIIPTLINIIIWYGLSLGIQYFTDGALTLSTAIIALLSVPLGYIISVPGMFIMVILATLLWFFGMHGTIIVYTAIMPVMIQAMATNAELAAAGMPLEFHPVFLFGSVAMIGGTGNTLGLVLLGLRSKSEQISAVSKAALGPGLFNINEPVTFGFPLMYNPKLLIPFVLNPLIVMFLQYIGFTTGFLALPQVAVLTLMPIGMADFLQTLSWRNPLFTVLMLPVTMLVWYPFFKIYEKELIEKEQNEKLEEDASTERISDTASV